MPILTWKQTLRPPGGKTPAPARLLPRDNACPLLPGNFFACLHQRPFLIL
jgi:hypothetical protein